ncbi:FtsW/RodA/SpoVE family cell cycle protein [Alloscardovia criceti]|uniref:FtsW/RodA/SpoVE family cell cycle protein n=1 Tax=Alloscardovia criceti TaxID=356828 RepID=UPI0003757EBE|nr:FtsW/RodA/SpoVE family cell cycle protein [Alloscardovia criceti]
MKKELLHQITLLALVALAAVIGFLQMFEKVAGGLPQRYTTLLIAITALSIIVWLILRFTKKYANQNFFFGVLLLTLVGSMEIIRIDFENAALGRDSAAGMNQLVWFVLALILMSGILIAVNDYRIFRKFSYISMVIGLILLFSPMVPGLGVTINGSRIWISILGHSVQPAEFAKIFMAIFFASYLFDHRDQLAVGGKKIGGLHLPRLRDLGPIIVVWAACMGVLVLQRDLGTGLLFFAMFVCMLYVATGRTSWILIGLVFFLIAAFAAVNLFSHVGNRVEAWLHPFDPQVYEAVGGSQQLVTGIFGLAAGGLLGTGLGQGYPALTPLANSDFIFSSLGEELGLTGIFAILAIYAVIIGTGIVTAIKVKDGFGKLLASGLVFTMAFQVFTVIGGITLVIPLTGLTLPYMAAGGSSLIANWVIATLLLIISNQANKPDADVSSDTFAMAAMEVIQEKQEQEKQREKLAQRESRAITSEAIPVTQANDTDTEAAETEAENVTENTSDATTDDTSAPPAAHHRARNTQEWGHYDAEDASEDADASEGTSADALAGDADLSTPPHPGRHSADHQPADESNITKEFKLVASFDDVELPHASAQSAQSANAEEVDDFEGLQHFFADDTDDTDDTDNNHNDPQDKEGRER